MAKKQKKQKKVLKIHTLYQISGNKIERKNKFCPKCKVFMGKHKDRWSCGSCGYTEFINKEVTNK